MRSLLVPSTAKYVFNKIKKNLENFGYKVEFASELEKYSGQNDSYKQSLRIEGFNTTYGKVFTIKDDAPNLELRLMSYKDWNDFQQYNLWAHIPNTNFSHTNNLVRGFISDIKPHARYTPRQRCRMLVS